MRRPARTCASTAALLALAVALRAETLNCKAVSTLPYVIDAPGLYCLTGSLTGTSTTGTAITIDAPDVILDLNGFTLNGSSPASSGVLVKGWKHVTVRNGTVTGFTDGVTLLAVGGNALSVVEDLRLQGNTTGIRSSAAGVLIRRNQVVTSGSPALPSAIGGIVAEGAANRVLENDVWGSGGPAILIDNGCHGCVVQGNRIVIGGNLAALLIDAPYTEAIVISDNTVVAGRGIWCFALYSQMACTVRDNVIRASSGPAFEGDFNDAGGNYPTP